MIDTKYSYKVYFVIVDDEETMRASNRILLRRIKDDPKIRDNFKISSTEILEFNSGDGLEEKLARISEGEQALFVGLLDQRMPGKYGTVIADELRRKHPLLPVSWVLYTAWAADEDVQNARKYGVFHALEKGKDSVRSVITDALYDAIHHILIREPAEKELVEPITFKLITSLDELVQAARLRYDVYWKDKRLDEQNTTGFEITSHDAQAYHYGGFRTNPTGKQELVATVRMITHQEVPFFVQLVYKLIAREPGLAKYLRETEQLDRHGLLIKPAHHPTVLDVKKEQEKLEAKAVQDFIAYASDLRIMELSRNIVREDFKGQDLSLMINGLAVGDSRIRGFTGAILSCAPRLLGMYQVFGTEKDPLGEVYLETIKYYSSIGRMDFTKLSERFKKCTLAMIQDLQTQDHVVITPENRFKYNGQNL